MAEVPVTSKEAPPRMLPESVNVPTLISAAPLSRVFEFISKVPMVVALPITSSLTTVPRSFNVPAPSKFAL